MKRSVSTLQGRIARKNGFSLVELLIVISVMAIMMAFALPYYIDWRKNINYRETAKAITSFMREARSKAIAKGLQHQVVISPTSSNYQLQVYNIATSSFDAPSQTLYAPPDVTIRSSLDGTATTSMTVIFNSNGTATITSVDGPTSGNVSINDKTTQKYLVTVLQTGRVSSQKK